MKNVKECAKKINIYLKNYKVASNRDVNKETNKWNKEKIYKNKKYIKMYIDIYKTIYMQTWKYTNIQKYRSAWRKTFIWKYERVYKQQKVKNYVNVFKNVYRKIKLDFWCFHLYLETYDFYHFLNRFVILNKNLLVLLDHFY